MYPAQGRTTLAGAHEDALPVFVTGVPALSSGSEIWIAIHNHHPEPLRLHSGQNIGVLEVVTVANTPSSISKPRPIRQPPVPEHLSPLQQQQLNGLFKEFSDVSSPGEDDLGWSTRSKPWASAPPALSATKPSC